MPQPIQNKVPMLLITNFGSELWVGQPAKISEIQKFKIKEPDAG
jgi:hypothetical protein